MREHSIGQRVMRVSGQSHSEYDKYLTSYLIGWFHHPLLNRNSFNDGRFAGGYAGLILAVEEIGPRPHAISLCGLWFTDSGLQVRF